MYVYPSHDRNDAQRYDMNDYHVYSSDDLANWQNHGVALSFDTVKWANWRMWAPDCAYKNGTCYFYFPTSGKFPGHTNTSGVAGIATSKSPADPFKDTGSPILGVTGIDPAVFVITTAGLHLLGWQ
jgi:oligosaccharide reducing-end xylanase